MLIGLCGPIAVGKTTLARMLETRYDFRRIRFAGTLKEMLAAMLRIQGVTEADIKEILDGNLKNTPLAAFNGRTSRYAQQTLGTEWGRRLIGENIWTSVAIRAYENLEAQGFNVAIDDVRFLDEAKMIHACEGTIVKISRPQVRGTSDHRSELEHEQIIPDFTVINDIENNNEGKAEYGSAFLQEFLLAWEKHFGEKFEPKTISP